MRQLEWLTVRTLGRIDPDPELTHRLARALTGTFGTPVDRLHDAVAQHQVDELALDALRRSSAGCTTLDELGARLAADMEAESRRWASVGSLLESTLARATAAGGRVMKGFDLRRHYPRPELRHRGDLDLHFRDVDSAVAFVTGLRGDGWRWDADELPWIKWDECGAIYGQFGLIRDAADGAELGVDVHVGPYSVGHCGVLPMVGLDEAGGIGAECALVLLAAHAMSHHRILMKDVNDAAMVVRSGRLDWASVLALSRSAGLEAALRQLLGMVRAEYGLDGVPEASGRGPLPVGAPGRWRRAAGIALLTWRQERGAGTAAAATRAAQALGYYLADLAPCPGGRSWRPGPESRRRARWYCWRLVPEAVWRSWAITQAASPDSTPAPERLSERVAMVRDGDAHAVTFGGEVFVPTWSGRVTDASIRLAARVAGDRC